jgi:endo-1,4-beta-D-glucanase Y
MLNDWMRNRPALHGHLLTSSMCAALVLGTSGCTGQPDSSLETGSSQLAPFGGPAPNPAGNTMAPAVGNDMAAVGEVITPPVDTSELDDTPPATGVTPPEEPPLSAAELAQLEGMDGLVRASDWNAPVSAWITETKVSRAYLEWKARFFKRCDDGSVYVLKNDYTGSEQVASEGIAYGMLLAVAMGDRPAFDGLWQYYREHRNGNGVMNWLHSPCGGEIGGNGASDADLDAAMALVLADSRYGGFAADARELVAAIGTHETQICGDGGIVLKPGDAWGGCGDVVNPSYFSPGYYRRFALVQPERAEFWNQFASDTYEMMRSMQDEVGGLLPDWGYDGRADDGDRGQYGYEAVRAPWRIALDLAWSNNPDPRSFLQRMSQTVDARGGITAMADDESFADKRNSAFLGSLSLSGLAVSQAKFDAYVAEWEAYEALDDQWYYQASLRVLFLITAGGFFPLTY